MQSEADGHTHELTNVSKGETQQPLKSWGKIADEKEPVSVQVVEWVVSFPFSFQFFTRLAAVFAEEVGDFFLFFFFGPI